MPVRVLYIAYPLLTVSGHSAGGAEQVLWTLEREMCRRGAHTVVAASAGSTVSGRLLSTGEPCSQADDFERRNREHQEKIIAFVKAQGARFDVIHDMSGSFWRRAAEVELPVLATLHLPRSFYPSAYFEDVCDNVAFNCVSRPQAASFADLRSSPGVVPNGIALDRFTENAVPPGGIGERAGLLWLGRICEEKAPHLALEIAAKAGLPLTLAGQVYPFSYHRQYFEREVSPRLRSTPGATFIDSPSFEQKLELLRHARALLITSQAAETSSLVAMEAAACGTPVIAFRRGALPEVVRDQVTGFLADSVTEAIAACLHVDGVSPEACTTHARQNFDAFTMAHRYMEIYARVLSQCGASAAQIKRAVIPREYFRPGP